MYLEEDAIGQLLQALPRRFPRHKLVSDLMSRKFFDKYSRTLHEKITVMGASFKFNSDSPEGLFLENGYELTWRVSIVERAVGLGSIKIPRFLLRTMLRSLATGYAIYVFDAR